MSWHLGRHFVKVSLPFAGVGIGSRTVQYARSYVLCCCRRGGRMEAGRGEIPPGLPTSIDTIMVATRLTPQNRSGGRRNS